MTVIPPGAISAAQDFDYSARSPLRNWTRVPDEQVERLLLGAMPLIAAAQREADARLADEAGAVCTGDEGTSCWFSAVLRTQQQRGTP